MTARTCGRSLGFELTGTDAGAMTAGAWYDVAATPGIYVSVMQTAGASALDGIERREDVYLVAFDMARFDIGY